MHVILPYPLTRRACILCPFSSIVEIDITKRVKKAKMKVLSAAVCIVVLSDYEDMITSSSDTCDRYNSPAWIKC